MPHCGHAPRPRVRRLVWRSAGDRERLLQVVQPGLIGLIDGTISTLAPIFAAAYVSGSRAALLVGIAAALGAAISMGCRRRSATTARSPAAGLAAARPHHGRRDLRRRHLPRPAVPHRRRLARADASPTPSSPSSSSSSPIVRKRYLHVSLTSSLVQVTAGGFVVAAVGVAVGHA